MLQTDKQDLDTTLRFCDFAAHLFQHLSTFHLNLQWINLGEIRVPPPGGFAFFSVYRAYAYTNHNLVIC